MSNPLKFCFVTTFYPPHNLGGEGLAVYRLANLLARNGHLVDVFYCLDSFQVLRQYPLKGDFPNHPDIKINLLKSPLGILSPLLTQQTGYPFFKKELIEKLKHNNYDVIHYHNMSLIGLKTMIYGSAVKLCTIHDHWLLCPMHALWKFNREVCTAKSCTLCQIAGGKPPQLWRHTNLLKKSLEKVDCFIAPSQYVLKKHLDSGLKIPFVHIPHFLPSSEVKEKSDAKKRSERPYFLFAGRLNKIKGVQNLIPVFKKLTEYNLLIAGEGEYSRNLLELAENYPNIIFSGGLSQEELREKYKNAEAVIVPSICLETFGLITIEAFAQKTPVIVNNLGALPEIVEKGNGGFVYNNQEELIELIHKIAQNKSLRDELGENGYQSIEKYWSEAVHLREYLGLIESLQAKKDL